MKILIIFSLFIISLSANAADVTLLTWWDLKLSPEIIKELKKKNIIIKRTNYNSNDEAKKLLASKKFDLVVLSNDTMTKFEKENLIANSGLESLIKERKYFPFFKKITASCLPYVWGATAFAYYKNPLLKTINSFKKLISAKKLGFKIAVINDKNEIFARALADQNSPCTQKGFYKDIVQCHGFKIPDPEIQKNEYHESLVGKLNKQTITYGWHGEIFPLSNSKETTHFAKSSKNSQIQVLPPFSRPLIGFTALCLTDSSKAKKLIKQVIAIITSKKSSEFTERDNQYFSPYVGEHQHLRPVFKGLLKKIVKLSKTSTPLFLTPLPKETSDKVEKWWIKIRY